MLSDASHKIACLLLAAGGSRRLGRPKQLLRMHGETLVHRAARIASEAGCTQICVTLGNAAEEASRELRDLPVFTIYNQDWGSGLSSSLRLGVSCLQSRHSDVNHLLVLVCDQVNLSVDLLTQLQVASSKNPHQIIAAEYEGRYGVPAVFPAAYLSRLSAVQGDRGARILLEEMRENVVPISWPGGSNDIDTPDDARRAGLTWDESFLSS